MSDRAALLGVFGGTFDPVHRGHLCIARALSSHLRLDRLHMIPAAQPPLKPVTGATAEQRLQMLHLALAAYSGFFIDLCEYRRVGPSYTVTTLQEVKQLYPQHHLLLIVGADTFVSLPDWHQSEALAKLAHLVVMNRSGVPTPILQAKGFTAVTVQQLFQQATGGILAVEVPSPDISSTSIRNRIAMGKDVSSMLCPAVWSYIQEQQLYGFDPAVYA